MCSQIFLMEERTFVYQVGQKHIKDHTIFVFAWWVTRWERTGRLMYDMQLNRLSLGSESRFVGPVAYFTSSILEKCGQMNSLAQCPRTEMVGRNFLWLSYCTPFFGWNQSPKAATFWRQWQNKIYDGHHKFHCVRFLSGLIVLMLWTILNYVKTDTSTTGACLANFSSSMNQKSIFQVGRLRSCTKDPLQMEVILIARSCLIKKWHGEIIFGTISSTACNEMGQKGVELSFEWNHCRALVETFPSDVFLIVVMFMTESLVVKVQHRWRCCISRSSRTDFRERRS